MNVNQLCDSNLERARAIWSELRQGQGASLSSVLAKHNELTLALDAAMSVAGLMANVHPDANIRAAAEKAEVEGAQLATRIALDRDVYDRLVGAAAQNDAVLSPPDARMLERTLRDFRRSGVDKSEAVRKQIQDLQAEIVVIGQEFDRNIREDVRSIALDSIAELDGLPEDYIAQHPPGPDGKIIINTDYPNMGPFMAYATSSRARERLAMEYKNRGFPTNDAVLKRLIQKRQELAQLLGYADWASYNAEDKMAKSPAAIRKFVDTVAEIALPRGTRELTELAAAKGAGSGTGNASESNVQEWERAFLENRVKQAKYAFDAREVRQYFEFTAVRDGLLQIISELFSVEFRQNRSREVWHPSVTVYDVIDLRDGRGGKTLGTIFLDLHPRADKYKHAAQFSLQTGIAGRQNPEGVLVCNFPEPVGAGAGKGTGGRAPAGAGAPGGGAASPALMEHGDVVTLFHEFGHLMHNIFGGHQSWARFSGVATEWDFVEVPSQLFEEWAWHPEVLQRFARHHQTGVPIPTDLVERMKQADEFGQGYHIRHQTFYAVLSLTLYEKQPAGTDSLDLAETSQRLQRQYSLFPHQAGTHFHLGFGHLHGYSSGYYTYLWSQVIAEDFLAEFRSHGMMNKEVADRYRRTVLEPGGTKDAADLAIDFLGRPYSFEPFRRSIA